MIRSQRRENLHYALENALHYDPLRWGRPPRPASHRAWGTRAMMLHAGCVPVLLVYDAQREGAA